MSCLRTQVSRPGLKPTLCWSETPVLLSTEQQHTMNGCWDTQVDLVWCHSFLLTKGTWTLTLLIQNNNWGRCQKRHLSLSYMSDLIHKHNPVRTLRSSSQHLLAVHPVNMHTYGDRSIVASAPTLWNSLPLTIRNTSSLDDFKSALKTHLFLQ